MNKKPVPAPKAVPRSFLALLFFLGACASFPTKGDGEVRWIGKTDPTGLKIGLWKEISADGATESEGRFDADGKKTGAWRTMALSNKTLVGTTEYVAGKKNGWRIGYYGTNVEKEFQYSNDLLWGAYRYNLGNGKPFKVGWYWSNQMTSNWTLYSAGILRETLSYTPVTVKNEEGVLVWRSATNGLRRLFATNGAVTNEETWVLNELTGPARTFHPSGALKSLVVYRAGKKQGPETNFYSNGAVQSVMEYRDDLLEGATVAFRPDGSLLRTGVYRGGMKNGGFTNYEKAGSAVARWGGRYVDDFPQGVFSFADAAGRKVMELTVNPRQKSPRFQGRARFFRNEKLWIEMDTGLLTEYAEAYGKDGKPTEENAKGLYREWDETGRIVAEGQRTAVGRFGGWKIQSNGAPFLVQYDRMGEITNAVPVQ